MPLSNHSLLLMASFGLNYTTLRFTLFINKFTTVFGITFSSFGECKENVNYQLCLSPGPTMVPVTDCQCCPQDPQWCWSLTASAAPRTHSGAGH